MTGAQKVTDIERRIAAEKDKQAEARKTNGAPDEMTDLENRKKLLTLQTELDAATKQATSEAATLQREKDAIAAKEEKLARKDEQNPQKRLGILDNQIKDAERGMKWDVPNSDEYRKNYNRLLDLKLERAAVSKQVDEANQTLGNEEKKWGEKRENAKTEIENLEEQRRQLMGGVHEATPQVNSISRMGGLLGGMFDPATLRDGDRDSHTVFELKRIQTQIDKLHDVVDFANQTLQNLYIS
jgi:DNA repair exonuclease SbcCD ATPase subunit